MTQDQSIEDIAPAREPEAPPLAKQTSCREHRDEILDEALMETFPASDPIELTAETAR